ncbi:hypothetical protein AGMMS49992_14130 [Clostridia bacterium]|nr:hypothetical protein AGMMS49992_14130 [Clostridia bacterium]
MESLLTAPSVADWDQAGIAPDISTREYAAPQTTAIALIPVPTPEPAPEPQPAAPVSRQARTEEILGTMNGDRTITIAVQTVPVAAAAAAKPQTEAAAPYAAGFDASAAGFNPGCCPGYYPGYVSSYQRQPRPCMPQCPPGFRFSALWDACVPIAPSPCFADTCRSTPVVTGCGCAKQFPTHHKQGYGSVSNCYYPGANSTCAPGYTRVGDKCVWTKW